MREGGRAGWQAVAAAAAGFAAGPSVVLMICFGVFMPAIRAEFGWPIDQVAFGASIISVAIMLISPLQGWLVDRFGPRRVVIASLPCWSAGLIAMAFLPPSIGAFYLACALLPLAGLGLWPISFMKLATTWFDRRLGLALGLTNMGAGIGATLMPLTLAALFPAIGWRGAYAVLGLLAVAVTLPVIATWMREGDRSMVIAGGGASVGLPLRQAVRDGAFWIVAAQFLVLGAVSTGLLVHQVAILVDAGVAQATAIAIQSAVGIGSIAGRIVTGWLLDRFSVQRVGSATFALAAAGCAILASDAAGSLAILTAAITGFLIGAEFDILGVLIRRYQGMAAFGRLYGLIFAAFQLGGAGGAAALAIVRTGTGSYAPGLSALAVGLVAAAALFALLGPYRFGREEPS